MNRFGSSGPINVDDELSAREEERRIEGERGAFDNGSRRGSQPGMRAFIMAMAAIILVFAVFFIWKAVSVRRATSPAAEAAQQVKISNPRRNVQFAGDAPTAAPPAAEAAQIQLGPDGQPLPPGATLGPNGEVVPAIDGTQPLTPGGAGVPAGGSPQRSGPPPKSPAQLLRERRLGGDLGGASGAGGAIQQVAQAVTPGGAAGGAGGGELQDALQPLQLRSQVAGKTTDRDYLLTRGAMLDCVLETKIVTTVAGMTSCYLTRDIYSASGRVVLLDRGSKVVGYYQGGLRRGQNRIFVQWSRVETPKGVIINVDSPGTGPLGESGMGGKVDNHFWQRFGGAIMLSLIDDLGTYAANQANSGNLRLSTGEDSSRAAEIALENSVNIPPTLYANQGDRVSVYIARDLDFRSVYGLAPK